MRGSKLLYAARGPGENEAMRKLVMTASYLLAAGLMLLWNAQAQQTPVASTQETPAAKPRPAPEATTQQASAAGAPKSPAAKPTETTRDKTQPPLALDTRKDKLSYALGMNLGTNLQKQSVEVDPAIVLRGLQDGLAGKTLLKEDEARALLMQLQAEVRSKQEEMMKVAGEANKKEGREFLAGNKAKEGIVTLPSGLEYKILTKGTGPKPTATDSVVCNYRGTLINGKEFDSSYKRGQPATFPVNGVIRGWTEALQLMPVGSKWQLFIPSDLAYGDRGAGPDIGPGATLIFEVELLSIAAKEKE